MLFPLQFLVSVIHLAMSVCKFGLSTPNCMYYQLDNYGRSQTYGDNLVKQYAFMRLTTATNHTSKVHNVCTCGPGGSMKVHRRSDKPLLLFRVNNYPLGSQNPETGTPGPTLYSLLAVGVRCLCRVPYTPQFTGTSC